MTDYLRGILTLLPLELALIVIIPLLALAALLAIAKRR